MLRLSDIDQARLELQCECLLSLMEFDVAYTSGSLSRADVGEWQGWFLTGSISLSCSGSLAEISHAVEQIRYARTHAQKQRELIARGDHAQVDEIVRQTVRNKFSPEMLKMRAQGTSTESILDGLRSLNVSPPTLEKIESALRNFG